MIQRQLISCFFFNLNWVGNHLLIGSVFREVEIKSSVLVDLSWRQLLDIHMAI